MRITRPGAPGRTRSAPAAAIFTARPTPRLRLALAPTAPMLRPGSARDEAAVASLDDAGGGGDVEVLGPGGGRVGEPSPHVRRSGQPHVGGRQRSGLPR